MDMNRRRMLTLGAALVFARPALAMAPERRLALTNLHTGEQLNTVYWAEGYYIKQAVAELAQLLRDHRSGEAGPIATGLLDLLHGLAESLGAQAPLEVFSGYRSPATNEWLMRNGTGVSSTSLHTRGMAADIHLPGCELQDLRRAALGMGRGGVGYYPASGFVHVDIGRVRTWSG